MTGDYAGTWSVTVSATTAYNGNQTHSGFNAASNGQVATVQWYDSPSLLGSGTYTDAEQHTFSNACGGNQSYNDSASLTVNQPTISGFFSTNSFWNLGPSSSDPQATLGTSNLIYQSVSLTFNSNCNAGDTCNDTPQWVASIGNNQASLSTTSGTSVTLKSAGSSRGTCNYDSSITANMGGFSTGTYPFAVNSPGSISLIQDSTVSIAGGYITDRFYIVDDVCLPTPNGLTAIPLYETFPSGFSQQNGSNWTGPTATTWPISNCTDCWSSNYYFRDKIGIWGAGWNPSPIYDTPSAPYFYNTVYLSGAHQFYSGTTTSGGGWQVYNGTIRYFKDHGDNNP